ncbi:MAG: ribonuclease J [Spirochaetia bacterium]|nr:ribonuclease J [Spirochaetia bacterium]
MNWKKQYEEKKALDQLEENNLTRIIRSTLSNDKLHVCFGGGVGAFGRNFTIFYYNGSTIWIDAGCGFPSYNLPGLLRTIPPKELIEAFPPDAIIFTHAHEDHIGALPYIYRFIDEDTPVYASDFTIAIIKKRLRDCKIDLNYFQFIPVTKNSYFKVRDFTINNFFVPHSIPQSFSVGVRIEEINMKIFFSSDFKLQGNEKNFNEKEIQNYGPVKYLFCDSTGILNSGKSTNENKVIENLEQIVQNWPGRIFMTTFASQIERLSEISKIAKKYNRHLGIRGQSIITHLESAFEARVLTESFWNTRRPDPEQKNAVWIISGCQADEGSSFQRFSDGKLYPLKPEKGDLLIYSASVIPSNTDTVFNVLNKLSRIGVKIIGLADYDPKVHTSGHARVEDLKQYISWLCPEKLIPVHGDHMHFMKFYEILENNKEIDINILEDNCIYSLENNVNEIMRIPAIPQMIEEKEIHTEYSLYSYRLNLSVSGICNLIIREDIKKLEQLQYIGTCSQEWLKKCMPELSKQINSLLLKMANTNENSRNRKLKQKISKINLSVLGKNPYVNVVWI